MNIMNNTFFMAFLVILLPLKVDFGIQTFWQGSGCNQIHVNVY